MAEYDLLSEDDFFSQTGQSSQKDKKKEEKEEEYIPPQDHESEEDDLFKDIDQSIENSIEDIPLDKEESDEDEMIEEPPYPGPSEEDESFDTIRQELEEETVEEEQNQPLIEDYEDEKQEGVNYKPFIIGLIVVVFLVVAFIVLYNLFWSGKGEQAAEQTQEEVQKEPKLSPEELKKQQFINSVYAQTKNKMGLVSKFLSSLNKTAKLSSFLIYGSDFMFEVFSPDREQLAKYSLDIRDRFAGVKVILDNTSIRPGKNGGILGLFLVKESTSPAEVTVNNPFTSAAEAGNWMKSLAANHKLNLGKIKTTMVGQQEAFTVYEIGANISGAFEDCNSFIQAIANSGKNISVHKLILNAADQRKFNLSKYKLTLILKVYI